jgi:hypothetical protein
MVPVTRVRSFPLKAIFPVFRGKAATNETEEEFQWQQD